MSTLKARTLFSVYSLVVLAAGAPILRDLFQLSTNNDTASHHLLIPFITLALMYQARHSIFASIRPDRLGGFSAIFCGAGLAVSAKLVRDEFSLTVAVAGLVLAWLGGFLLCWGRDAFRRALFPLLFLGFAIPIPNVLIENVTHILKAGSADLVAGLFTVTRTPYHRIGYVFALPDFAIEIADECSGIRSSIALMLTGLLAGDQLLRTAWKKAVIVLVVLPLAIVKNGIRIVGLSLLATHVDPAFLTGQLHHEGGVVFFLLTLAMMAPLLVFLRSSEMIFAKDDAR